MRKKILSLLTVICMIIILIAVPSAQTNIIDSMDFQGELKELTLSAAKEIALKNNPDIMQEGLNVEQSKIDAAKIIDSPLRSSSSSINGTLERELNKLNAYNTTDSAQRNYEITILKVKAELEQAYYSVLNKQQSVSISKSNFEISKELLDKAKKKNELGLVAKQEVLTAELGYTNAQNTYNSAVNDLKKAKMDLNIKLGYDVMTELKLKDDLKYFEYNPGSIATAVNNAISKRAEIKVAEYTYNVQKLTLETEQKIQEKSYDAELANIKLQKVNKTLDNARKSVELDVRSKYLDILQKREEIKAGQKAVENTAEALNINKVKYETGMGILTDFQSSQNEYLKAQLNLSNAILNYNLAVSAYKDAQGIGRNKTVAQ